MSAFIVSLLALSAALPEPGYVSIGSHDGVQVFMRQDSAIVDLAAVGEFDTSPAEVHAALIDYGAHPKYNKRLAESSVLSRRPGELLVYQYLKLPVIKDRDYALRVGWRDGDPHQLTFAIDGKQGPAPTNKTVRLTTLTGRWDLEPIRGGAATRAVYHVRIDFSGTVPRWMVRGGAAKDLPLVFAGMRRLIAEHRLISRR